MGLFNWLKSKKKIKWGPCIKVIMGPPTWHTPNYSTAKMYWFYRFNDLGYVCWGNGPETNIVDNLPSGLSNYEVVDYMRNKHCPEIADPPAGSEYVI